MFEVSTVLTMRYKSSLSMKKFYLLFTGLIFCLFTSSVYAQKIFMKADDLTNGASKEAGYLNYTELSSLQFGVSAATTFSGVGAPIPDQITVTKNVDISSNKFLNKIFGGDEVTLLEIVSLVPSGNGFVVAHKIELKDAYFADISSATVQGCVSGCPAIAESYKMTFRAIRITTYSVNSSGVLAPNVFNYNVQAKTFTF